MANFTEYVRLIADATESLAAITKLNEAIVKLRHSAEAPIHVRIQSDFEKAAAGEKKNSQQRINNINEEEKALKKKLEVYKAMNMNQGGSFNNKNDAAFKPIRPVINSEMDKQIEATTKRLNELAIAKNKIKSVAQESGVDLSHSELGKLAGQTVTNTEREMLRLAKEKLQIKKEEEALWAKQTQMSMKLKENNNNIEASAGAKAQIEMEQEALRIEKERIAAVRERNAQEEEGAKRQIAMDRETQRLEQQTKREAQQAVREQERVANKAKRDREEALAASREGGIRGIYGEGVRDIRRNLIYGGIGRAEQLGEAGFEHGVARSREVEQQFQSGRTPEEQKMLAEHAQSMSDKNPVLSKTESMILERHAIGEVGDVKTGVALADLASPFIALRTAAVGAEQALSENQKIMKGFNELSWVQHPEVMKAAYESLAKMTKVEGANFNPSEWLGMIRMLKSGKYAMSDEAITKMAPVLGIGEGQSRIGNEYAMLFKSLAFSGKSIDNSVGKDNHRKYIDGTGLSDGKGGFNPELAKNMALGTTEGIRAFDKILNDAATKKGVNADDPLAFNQWLGKIFGNTSARELAMLFHEKPDFIDKQLGMYGKAKGLEEGQGADQRDIGTAWTASQAKFDDMSSAMVDQIKTPIIWLLDKLTKGESWASKNPGAATTGIGVLGTAAYAALETAIKDPQAAVNSANLGVIAVATGITAKNTSTSALSNFLKNEKGGGGPGALGTAGSIIAGAAVGTAIQQFAIQPIIDASKNKDQEENINKYRVDSSLAHKVIDQVPDLISKGDYNQGASDDPRPTKDAMENQVRIATEAIRRNDRDLMTRLSRHASDERDTSIKKGSNTDPMSVAPVVSTVSAPRPSWVAPWHLGTQAHQGVYNSGGVSNNGLSAKENFSRDSAGSETGSINHNAISTTPVKLDTSGVQSAWDEIKSAGAGAGAALSAAGEAVKGGLSGLGSTLSGAGGAVVSALHAVAAEISAVHINSPAATPASSNPGSAMRGPR